MALLASVAANSLPDTTKFVAAPAVVQIDRRGHVISPPASQSAPPNSNPTTSLARKAESLNRTHGLAAYAALIPPRPHIAFLSGAAADQMTEIALFQAQQQTMHTAPHTYMATEQTSRQGRQQSQGPVEHSCGFRSFGGTPHP
jgi:hypothetical protein